jgi:hypothetical protein
VRALLHALALAIAAAASLIVLAAAIQVLWAWGPGRNDDLKAIVEEVWLPGATSDDCEWGSSSFESEPKSWYGCWQYVSDSLAQTSRVVKQRLASRGFRIRIENPPDNRVVALVGTRGADVVCIDVLAPGFRAGRNTAPQEINPSPGQVFVDIWIVEPSATSGPRCAALPSFPDE